MIKKNIRDVFVKITFMLMIKYWKRKKLLCINLVHGFQVIHFFKEGIKLDQIKYMNLINKMHEPILKNIRRQKILKN